jgi:Holliday junction resolvasome RuvABC DNA-binding subunit
VGAVNAKMTIVPKRDAHVGAVNAKMTIIPKRDAHVGAGSQLDAAIVRTQAKTALTAMGWKPAIAANAVASAAEALGADVVLERLIFEALRRCPVPKG